MAVLPSERAFQSVLESAYQLRAASQSAEASRSVAVLESVFVFRAVGRRLPDRVYPGSWDQPRAPMCRRRK